MTTIDQQDLDSVDLADPSVWDDGPPYELFARMQREAPVHFSPQHNHPDEGGFWSITGYDDVRAVSRDHRTFSSERRGIFHMDDIGVPLDLQRLQLISMDPPRHDRLKALVIKEFTPEAVGTHEGSWLSPTGNYYRGAYGTLGGAATDEWGNSLYFNRNGENRSERALASAFDLRGHFLDCIEKNERPITDGPRSLQPLCTRLRRLLPPAAVRFDSQPLCRMYGDTPGAFRRRGRDKEQLPDDLLFHDTPFESLIPSHASPHQQVDPFNTQVLT